MAILAGIFGILGRFVGKLLTAALTVCAWCGTEFGRPVIADALPAPVVEPVVWPTAAEPNVEAARA